MRINTIGSRIALGFGALIATLAISAVLAIWQSSQLSESNHWIREVGAPTVAATSAALNGINETQSALKSWLLFRKDEYRAARRDAWSGHLEPAIKKMAELTPRWLDPRDVQLFKSIQEDLLEFRDLQDSLERQSISSVKVMDLLNKTLSPKTAAARDKLEKLIADKNAIMDQEILKQRESIRRLNLLEIFLVIGGAFGGILIAVLLVKNISAPIQKTITLADKVASGDYSANVSFSGTDEVVRLGSALERMRESLHVKTWFSDAQIRFNESIRGVNSSRELADATIASLAKSLPVQIGAFYEVEGKTVKTIGGYALPQSRAPGFSFDFGEGLAGQAAVERRALSFTGRSDDGFVLETAAGTLESREVMAAPLVYRDAVLGVMELGLGKQIAEHEKEFIRIAAASGAVVFDSVRQSEKVKDLLHETQAQSEELQLQQEELKAANEELQSRQDELQASNDELEAQKKTLDLKNAELEIARQEIVERAEELDRISKYKSEFLANMSHELRTPLNSQLILSKLLSENREGNLTEKQVEFVKTIHATGQDLLKLINDILDLSKVEAGKLDLDLRETRLQEIASDLQRDFTHMAEQKNLDFKVEIDPNAPKTILTDAHRLGQVVRNLLSNAVKFTEKGSVTLRIERPAKLAKSHPFAAANPIAFRVVDTGIGIPQDQLGAIFQAFEQVDSSIGRKFGGTGLGLAISKNLAELLGGELTVTSTLGEGSVFTLLLPGSLAEKAPKTDSQAKREPKTAPRIPVKAPIAAKSEKQILIIEDDAKFASLLAEFAEKKGFVSVIARDGAEGLALTHKETPSCIFLDIRLPQIDGLRILKELKSKPETRHIPVYMISVNDQCLEALKLGAMGYIVKPADQTEIEEALDRLKTVVEGGLRHVLVVEDDPVQRNHVEESIGNGKVKTISVSDGAEAFAKLKSGIIFDCIVLDLKLPDMSGFEFLEKLNRDKSIEMPPVVIYTAKDLTREEEEKLNRYSETIIIKGAKSVDRLLDEVNLFTHRRLGESAPGSRIGGAKSTRHDPVLVGKEVLLVDDEVRNIFALSSALEASGLNVTLARNGQEALGALEASGTIDLVLMDIMMPVMDGIEAIRRIRQSENFKDLPVIALTAKAMKEDRRVCLEAGANDYLAKPVDLDRLFSLLRVWMT